MASRKNQDELVANPAKHFIEWSNTQTTKVIDGEEYKKLTGGQLKYSVKSETEENKWDTIIVDMPFEFAILNSDCFSWKSKKKGKDVPYRWTNEVNEYTKKVILKEKVKGENSTTLMSFLRENYKKDKKKDEIKEQLTGFGMEYNQCVYISPKTESGYIEVWALVLAGGEFSGGNGQKRGNEIDPEDKYDGWMGFQKLCKLQNKNLLSCTVIIDGYKAKQNGDVKFFIPEFQTGEPITKEESDQLGELFAQLEAYHKFDAKRHNSQETSEDTPVTAGEDDGFVS